METSVKFQSADGNHKLEVSLSFLMEGTLKIWCGGFSSCFQVEEILTCEFFRLPKGKWEMCIYINMHV